MKRLLTLVTLILIPTITALAQDDYKKYEFFAGYSALYLDNLAGDTSSPAINDVLGEKQNLRGFNLAAGYNFHKYVGAKFDYSLLLREDNFTRPLGSGTIDTTLQNFLGGIQIKNNSEDGPTFKPFGHALFGVAVQKVDVDSPQLPALFGISDFHGALEIRQRHGARLELGVEHGTASDFLPVVILGFDPENRDRRHAVLAFRSPREL